MTDAEMDRWMTRHEREGADLDKLVRLLGLDPGQMRRSDRDGTMDIEGVVKALAAREPVAYVPFKDGRWDFDQVCDANYAGPEGMPELPEGWAWKPIFDTPKALQYDALPFGWQAVPEMPDANQMAGMRKAARGTDPTAIAAPSDEELSLIYQAGVGLAPEPRLASVVLVRDKQQYLVAVNEHDHNGKFVRSIAESREGRVNRAADAPEAEEPIL